MNEHPHAQAGAGWLKTYYLTRAAFSLLWVAAAATLGRHMPAVAAALLVCYPAWDALANLVDARRSGGLAANRTQALNVAVSVATAAGVAAALPDLHTVLAVFGMWAILSGLLQLGTALRRWKAQDGQWAMVLSGAQSALAGAFFVYQSRSPADVSIATVTGYAAIGALYFLVSGGWLIVRARRLT